MVKAEKLMLALAAIVICAAVLLSGVQVKANPSFEVVGQSASATTTYNRIALGTGTTTVNLNTTGNLIDSAILHLMLSASTTAPAVYVRFESSVNGIDYYPQLPVNSSATTTSSEYVEYFVAFSTSTVTTRGNPGSGSLDTFNRVVRSIPVQTPTRYTRAIIYGAIGSGSLYAELRGKQQAY